MVEGDPIPDRGGEDVEIVGYRREDTGYTERLVVVGLAWRVRTRIECILSLKLSS